MVRNPTNRQKHQPQALRCQPRGPDVLHEGQSKHNRPFTWRHPSNRKPIASITIIFERTWRASVFAILKFGQLCQCWQGRWRQRGWWRWQSQECGHGRWSSSLWWISVWRWNSNWNQCDRDWSRSNEEYLNWKWWSLNRSWWGGETKNKIWIDARYDRLHAEELE